MNALAQAPPVIERPDKAELLDALDRAIERDPGHDFRVGEMPPRPANLPDSFVGQFPDHFKMLQELDLKHPIAGIGN